VTFAMITDFFCANSRAWFSNFSIMLCEKTTKASKYWMAVAPLHPHKTCERRWTPAGPAESALRDQAPDMRNFGIHYNMHLRLCFESLENSHPDQCIAQHTRLC
jgi:hypothetical protein